MEYEINNETNVILPIDNNSSKILETSDEYIINDNTLKIMEHSCEYFGSSYSGRKEGTKNLIGTTHKSPIIIEESKEIIFFPTTSPENPDCVWINLEKIDKYIKLDKKRTKIIFKNGNSIEFNVSYGSLSNQILRASRLKYILEERINKKEDNIL